MRLELESSVSDLEDSNYEHSLSETKELLDSLYNAYEEVLNERLDNVDALFAEMLDKVDTNAGTIAKTITEESKKAGYTITEGMNSIWETAQGSITGSVGVITGNITEGFKGLKESVNEKLTEILQGIQAKNETEEQEKSEFETNLKEEIDRLLGALNDKVISEEEQKALEDALQKELDKLQGELDAATKEELSLSVIFSTLSENFTQGVNKILSGLVQLESKNTIENTEINTSITSIKENLDTYFADMKTKWTELFEALNRINTHLSNLGSQTENVSPSVPSTPSVESPTVEPEKTPFVPKVGATLSDVTGRWYHTSNGGINDVVDREGANSWEIEKINEGSKYPYHLIGYKDGEFAGSGWVDENAFPEYHNGLKSATKDHLGWTQDDGEEVIIRRSDGAILTPLPQGSMVLNNTATARFWEAMNNPTQFIGDYMPKAQMPDLSAIKGGNVNNVENHFDFNITGVTNLDDLAREIKVNLQHDHKFEKMIQDIVINPLVGGSRLAKYTYNFK